MCIRDSAKDEAVAAGKSDRGLAMRAKGRNQSFVDAAAEHHQGGVARFRIGDAQAGDEFALLAELLAVSYTHLDVYKRQGYRRA